MSLNKGKLIIQKNGFTLIEAYETKSNACKIVCEGNRIRYYIGNNSRAKRSPTIKSSCFFQFHVRQLSTEIQFSIHYFDTFIGLFRWSTIADIPAITDAFSKHFNLEYFNSYKISEETEALIFYSTEGKKNRQILKTSKRPCEFHIHFYDVYKTHFLFDQLHQHIVITNSKGTKIFPFKDLKHITFYLNIVSRYPKFDNLLIEGCKTTGQIIPFLEFQKLFNPQTDKMYLVNLPGKQLFNVIIELIQKLRQIPELASVDIRFDLQ